MFWHTKNSDRDIHLSLLSQAGLPTNGSNWWVKHPGRAIDELNRMLSSTNARVLHAGSKMIFKEEISNNFGTRFLIAIETQDFPFKMPKVFLEEPRLNGKAKHMWKDGSLCLLDPDDYHSSISILDIRNLAAAWCFSIEVYANTGEWPAAEH